MWTERWEGLPRYDLTVVVNDKLHAHTATVLIDTLKEAKFHDSLVSVKRHHSGIGFVFSRRTANY